MRSTIVIPLSLAAVLYLAPASVRAADDMPDGWITTKAKVAVLSSVGTTGTKVHVDTNDGLVTLHGTVASSDDRASAEKAVAKLDGVKKVRNLLEVVAPKAQKDVASSDDDLQRKVDAALRKDKVLADEQAIKIESVNNGTVLLSGNASSLSNHLRAIEDVRAVPGVKRVASTIESPDSKAVRDAAMQPGSKLGGTEMKTVKTERSAGAKSSSTALSGAASDAYITTKTKARLLVDSDTPGTAINVDTKDGVVTLFGTVTDESAKSKAEAEARKVDGVKQVRNEIEVVPASAKNEISRNDRATERSVQKAVANDDALAKASISVEVRNGVARLTGTAPSEKLRKEAEKIAKRSDGVKSVRNEIEVRTD